jgi:hypothetical protein
LRIDVRAGGRVVGEDVDVAFNAGCRCPDDHWVAASD